jgi:uncharacterized protein YyaL (SSP411 family)
LDANLLSTATSPYLLQHAHQPVHWRQWGAAALADAKSSKKPIFLSIGYAACHWCHVMAHESFDNPDIADILNRDFVCIKVDREERPDIDQIYMTALHAMGQQGGWPLTMFLDADGAAFWGGTYFPPESRWGRPGLPDILAAVAHTYRENASSVASNIAQLRQAVAQSAAAVSGDLPDETTRADVVRTLLRLVDPDEGGLRGAPKFPNFPLFALLAQEAARGDPDADAACSGLARALCRGGIHDHVGGGLYRYATDGIWLVPHFEKMLYDNAQFLECLALAHARHPSPLLADTAVRLVAFMNQDLTTAGGFAASLDADSPGGEGAFYVWTEAEVDTLLGDRAEAFKTAYDVTPAGNWEGHSILHRVREDDAELFAEARHALARHRAKRAAPALDDKLLADWNGLAVRALCRAAAVFDRDDWVARAATVFAALLSRLTCGNRLCHSWREGRIGAAGLLDDLASCALAAIALHEATGQAAWLDQARDVLAQAETWHGPAQTGYFLTASDADDLPPGFAVRPRSAVDGPTPSGSGMMAEALARMYHLTGDPAFATAARQVVEAFAGTPTVGHASLLAACTILQDPVLVVVIGTPGLPETAALARTARAGPDPTAIVLRCTSGLDLPPSHPAHGKTAPPGTARAYVCRQFTCLPPVADPGALRAILSQR